MSKERSWSLTSAPRSQNCKHIALTLVRKVVSLSGKVSLAMGFA